MQRLVTAAFVSLYWFPPPPAAQSILPTTVVLNIGKSQGVKVSDTLKVYRVLSTIKDPTTGKVLCEMTEEVRQTQIKDVDDVSSGGTIISGVRFKVGDLVKRP